MRRLDRRVNIILLNNKRYVKSEIINVTKIETSRSTKAIAKMCIKLHIPFSIGIKKHKLTNMEYIEVYDTQRVQADAIIDFKRFLTDKGKGEFVRITIPEKDGVVYNYEKDRYE